MNNGVRHMGADVCQSAGRALVAAEWPTFEGQSRGSKGVGKGELCCAHAERLAVGCKAALLAAPLRIDATLQNVCINSCSGQVVPPRMRRSAKTSIKNTMASR